MITIEGTVEEIIYHNELNGYTVCDIRREKDIVTAVGYMPFIHAGECLKVCGRWVNHPDYGEQLKVESYEKQIPQTSDAIERYLASGVIKGVGPVTAQRIVETFGEDALNIIHHHPDRLSMIKGISLDKAIRIGQAFEEQKGLREVVMFFQDFGISTACAAKIYKTFGDRTIDEIKTNPYKLADEIFGISFKTADRIAMRLGIDASSRFRVCSGIKYVLSQGASTGHTYIPEERLQEYTSQLLGVNLDSIRDALVSLLFDNAIYVEKNSDSAMVYLSAFHQAENAVCRKLAELAGICFTGNKAQLDEKILWVQEQEGIALAENQKLAVSEALLNGILVVTGGPGTGKTTIIRSIIRLLSKEGFEIALAAPTGRAAKRMTEATGFEAKTIHRLLEIGYLGTSDADPVFNRNETNPIDADVIIIDEVSMVDILLMNHLLKAIAPGSRLILVGDVDQLPSVGPGNVLQDIISSGIVKTVYLKEIFRQAEESMIIVNAHRINRGEMPYVNRKEKDFFFMSRPLGDYAVRTIVELCSRRLPDSYRFDPMRHIQVLTPTRKGITGVASLNAELQKALNPPDPRKSEKNFRDFTFREGDKVMQVKNNYNLRWEKCGEEKSEGLGVFNGDLGIIQSIDLEEQKISVLFDDDKKADYDFSILDELEPAYATTIHKSQGSEFPAVVIPLLPGPQMLMTRNLLYTAVTRAKSLVVLVGSEEVLAEMVGNNKQAMRYSGLREKLNKIFQI